MKNLVIKVFMVIVACLFSMQQSWAVDSWNYPGGTPNGNFGGGDGTKYSPYLITSAQQLADLAYLVNDGNAYAGKFFELTTDITLNEIIFDADNKPLNLRELKAWTHIGEYGMVWNDYFSGSFDGNGHTISGLYINADKDEYTGLFGAIRDAEVRNLKIKDSYMLGDGGKDATGFLVGYMKNSVIRNCHISNSHIDIGTNKNCKIGGIAGQGAGDVDKVFSSSFSGTIKVDHSSGIVFVAGIMGLGDPRFENCRVDGQMNLYAVNSGSSGAIYANGLCYWADDIFNCMNSLNFTVQNEGGSSELHNLNLNTLCYHANNVYYSANFGGVTINTTNGWVGNVGNIFSANSVENSAFYGSFKGGSNSTDGKITYYYFGDENIIHKAENNVFLCKDDYTFVSSNTNRFNREIKNLTPGTDNNGVYAYSEDQLKTAELFSKINQVSTTMYVWGKIKDRGDFLDGCPLPVACGGVLDADFKGEGTEESPWLIGSEAELRKLAEDVNGGKIETTGKFFALTADIDMSASTETFPSIGSKYSLPFYGTLDGKGHAISNIKLNNGLFGYLNGTVKNLAVVNVELIPYNSQYQGVIASYLSDMPSGTITNCYAGGDITIGSPGNYQKVYIGGLCCKGSKNAKISDSYFKGRIDVGQYDIYYYIGGLVGSMDDMTVENSYASFEVDGGSATKLSIAGLAGERNNSSIFWKYGVINNCCYVCDQATTYDKFAKESTKEKVTKCTNDSEIFADNEFPTDSPWTKGAFRPVLKDAKNYAATAADGSDKEVYYDAIAMSNDKIPSNDIYHYTLKDGEENDLLLWALPNLAIYNPADKNEYIINCTLDPTKPFNYNTKTSCKAEEVKVNMSYPLTIEARKYYYPLCLPGTVHKDDFLFGAELYIGGEVKTDDDGNKYMNLVQADSVAGGIPFVAYIPSFPISESGSTINVSIRSRMAVEPLKSITDGEKTQNFALTGTYEGNSMNDVCNNIVESQSKIYIKKVEGQQTVPPFSAYLSDEDNVELRNYLLLDETSNDIAEVIADNNGKGVKTMLKRALVKGKWNTICLPTTLSSSYIAYRFGEGTKLEQLSSVQVNDDGGCTLVFTKATDIEAGKSYLIMPTNDNVVYNLGYCEISDNLAPSEFNVTIDGVAATIKFCGTFERKMLGVDDEEEYFTQGNTIYHVADGQQIVMNGFRCYITASKGVANAMAKARMVHSDGSTTDLRLVEVGSTADGKQRIYNLQGIEQSSDSQQRGVYIKGGRKYVK